MDAITMLRDDHKAVKRLFRAFERLDDDDATGRRKLVDAMIRELSVHVYIEEQVFYPAVRASDEEAEDTILESLEEHHVVKWILSELEDLAPDNEHFKAKVTVLIESVQHHADEEESELFPSVRKTIGRKELVDMGKQLEAAKRDAPATPQPRAA
jgi:hemerythrin-like domain-containing protein